MIKIRKIGFMLIGISVFLLCGCNQTNVKQDESEVISDNVVQEESINIDELIVDETILLSNLKSISENVRNYGSEGDIKSSSYIREKLNEYGYDVNFQEFDVYKQDIESTFGIDSNLEFLETNPYNSESLGTGRNIIATKSNLDTNKKTLYFTAHYDSTSDTTGVIDNASGSTVIMELARLLKNYNNKDFNIGFIFFGAEEYCRFGSRYFVSNLRYEEKDNILGCINIDMVGEKEAGDVIMQTVAGRQNILSLMMSDIFKLQSGGSSDELSFYMGEIPAITITNENSNPYLSREENQLQYIEISELREICQDIIKFIGEFNIDIYNNKIYYEDNLESLFEPINDFELVGKKQTLLKRGYDSEIQYTYENTNNKIYTIKVRDGKFIPKEELSNMIIFDVDNQCGYRIEETAETKVVFNVFQRFGEITGDISNEEALSIIDNYYNSSW